MPLEPLFTLEVACELIPIGYHSLTNLLSKYPNKFPPRYHIELEGENGPRRMLYESECLAIREMVISNTRIGIRRQIRDSGFRRRSLNLQIVRMPEVSNG